jgi:hypothetical protein
LVLLPNSPDEVGAAAVGSFSEVAHRHKLHQRKLFPFYVLPEKNGGYAQLKGALGLGNDLEIIAVNGRRGWWKKLPSDDTIAAKDVTEEAIENWVDAIRLGEGAKEKLSLLRKKNQRRNRLWLKRSRWRRKRVRTPRARRPRVRTSRVKHRQLLLSYMMNSRGCIGSGGRW